MAFCERSNHIAYYQQWGSIYDRHGWPTSIRAWCIRTHENFQTTQSCHFWYNRRISTGSKLLHGDNVRFVVAHVDCEVFQRLMAVLGTCWAVSVIIPRLDRQVVSSVNRTTPVVRVFAEPIKSRKDSIFTRLDTPLKKSFANIRGLLRLQEPKTSLFERKGKGSGWKTARDAESSPSWMWR